MKGKARNELIHIRKEAKFSWLIKADILQIVVESAIRCIELFISSEFRKFL